MDILDKLFENDNSLDFLDIGLDDVNFKHNKNSPQKSKNKHKIFMQENNIFIDKKKSQYNIIYNLLNDLELPKKGETYRIRTQQSINLFGILSKILYENEIIEELVITTYTMNIDIFKIIIKMFDEGKIKKIYLMLASSYSFRSPENYTYFKNICRDRFDKGMDITLIFVWCHFKITLCKTKYDYYQFEGSMNYSINNMAENIIICNDKEVYENDENFIKNIMTDSTNKALEIITPYIRKSQRELLDG